MNFAPASFQMKLVPIEEFQNLRRGAQCGDFLCKIRRQDSRLGLPGLHESRDPAVLDGAGGQALELPDLRLDVVKLRADALEVSLGDI